MPSEWDSSNWMIINVFVSVTRMPSSEWNRLKLVCNSEKKRVLLRSPKRETLGREEFGGFYIRISIFQQNWVSSHHHAPSRPCPLSREDLRGLDPVTLKPRCTRPCARRKKRCRCRWSRGKVWPTRSERQETDGVGVGLFFLNHMGFGDHDRSMIIICCNADFYSMTTKFY